MNTKQFIFICLTSLFAVTCIHAQQTKSKDQEVEQMWLGKLKLNDSTLLYFDFGIINTRPGMQIIIHNAKERIAVDEVSETKDSLNFRMPVFDSEFKCKKNGDSLSGLWINHSRKTNNILTFHASKAINNNKKIGGLEKTKWEVTFNPATSDEYKGIGLFEHGSKAGEPITGTILTETGDYRYLAGSLIDTKTFYLSCFDGTHAFVFKAKLKTDNTLEGDFWAGSHGHEKWTAKLNDNFKLKDPDSLTYLNPGFDKINFSFPDLDGKQISLQDDKYKNKVVIVQIMGSWCPNCIDETKFLSGFYEKYNPKGLEIIGLAYERTGEMTKAIANVQRIKKKLNCNYTILIAGTSSDKNEAAKTLPMLNHVMGYPTTIYIDKKGKVRKIYTGFNGPATGWYYDKYVESTNTFVDRLLKEK